MGKSQRTKGATAERAVVNRLREAGIKADKVPLSGGAHFRGEGHDVTIHENVKAEVKIRKADFARIYAWLEDNDMLMIRRDRDQWLVVMRLEDWIEKGAFREQPVGGGGPADK